jgi:hypothetical protein
LAAVIPLKHKQTLSRIPTESVQCAEKVQERLAQIDSQFENFG